MGSHGSSAPTPPEILCVERPKKKAEQSRICGVHYSQSTGWFAKGDLIGQQHRLSDHRSLSTSLFRGTILPFVSRVVTVKTK